MMRYAITDRRLFPGDEHAQRSALIAQAGRLARAGVDYLQLREKDLPEADRVALAREMRLAILANGGRTRLLLSGSPALAFASAAVDGVHLTSLMLTGGWSPQDFERGRRRLTVSISCHSPQQVSLHRSLADVILFAPVFEKRVLGEQVREGAGLEQLRQACLAAQGTPVFALGGVDTANAAACAQAGASGIAGIRMFL